MMLKMRACSTRYGAGTAVRELVVPRCPVGSVVPFGRPGPRPKEQRNPRTATTAGAVGTVSFISKVAAAPVAPVAETVLQFTPLVGLVGGLVLGLACFSKYVLTGRILGISGAVKGCLTGDWRSWRIAFLLGLMGGGVVAGIFSPEAFAAPPATFTVERAAAGGLLVGLGSALGNGCTSGHGIMGNARLSPRSFAFTLTMMAVGAAVASLTGTALALGVAQAQPPLVLFPGEVVAQQGGLLLATALLAVAGLGALARGSQNSQHKALGLLTELTAGTLFAWGLTFSGMVMPAKVAAFLSPLAACWDPTLAFVMGGALAVALPGVQWVKRAAGAPHAPLCEPGGCFSEPAASAVDAKLVAGGALFGAGWGLAGMCPGPALVALVATLNPAPQIAAFVGAMVAGMAVQCACTGSLAPLPPPAKAA